MRFLVAVLVLATASAAGPTETGRPRHNNSWVPDDDAAVRELVLAAERAAEESQFLVAAGKLQQLFGRSSEGVVAVRGRELFTSPRRWALLALLGERPPFGPETLKAWRALHDSDANGSLRAAMATGDEASIRRSIDRFPAASGVPHALLLLADRALQRGERTAARALSDRVPEHVARSDIAFLQSPAVLARKKHLDAIAEPPPKGWPTLGGAAHRARNGDTLPSPDRWTLLWETPLLDAEPWGFRGLLEVKPRLQSPTLPFYPVCDEKRIYIHLGTQVRILDRASGKTVGIVPPSADPDAHTDVSAMIRDTPDMRAATIHDGIIYFNRLHRPRTKLHIRLYNDLIAYDTKARRTLWLVGRSGRPGRADDPLLRRGVFFRGAPAIADGRLFVYGAVRELEDSGKHTRKEEAHLFCFDAKTGRQIWRRRLGYADTDAPPTFPPASGLAPAVARGVVVIVTNLGVAAALDASTGEYLWLLRYDRLRFRERQRLSEEEERSLPHKSAWFREPPRIVGDSVYFAPTDSESLLACWLRGARIDGSYYAVRWDKSRKKDHFNCLLEHVAGIEGGRVFCVGRRDERQTRLFESVVSVPLETGRGLAYARLPATRRDRESGLGVPPEIFGRPFIAGRTLLVPTERVLYRFDLASITPRERDLETIREIGMLQPYGASLPEDDPRLKGALFGTAIAVDGRLYAVTADRVLAYGSK